MRGEVCVRDLQDGRKPRGGGIHLPQGCQVSESIKERDDRNVIELFPHDYS